MKKNISVIYFDEDTPREDIHQWCKGVKDVLGKDNAVIALPKKFDLMLECSLDQLLQVRAMIDTAIEMKCEMRDQDNECEEPLSATSGVH